MTWSDAEFPADPYPGSVPPASYVHEHATAHPLRSTRGGWAVGRLALDAWLAERDAPPTAARVPVLTYGSNHCPSKVTWLREHLGLGPDPVVVLRVRTTGVAAVWAHGLRARDGQRPAVLAAAPADVVEEHAVWLATPEQVRVLDACEVRGTFYRLARLATGTVRTEDGALLDRPWVYLGANEDRRPLQSDGAPVRCADVPQHAALALTGPPAASDGLDAPTVDGAPHADEWPPRLFVYGTLRPGSTAWDLLAPHTSPAAPRRARVPGTVLDTGLGFPAWLPGEPGDTAGVVVELTDPVAAFPALDAYEGPQYERVRVTTGDGTVCWAYAWREHTEGFTPFDALGF